jgi:methylenetetrahydrofolate dehydrogenase (NADP+)/methenyltetrahydrofolate cyclohydrolase
LLRAEAARGAVHLRAEGIVPKLAVVLVGDDPASHTYVKFKVKACAEVGIESSKTVLPADTSPDQLYSFLAELNADESVHGILVQLPLPDQLDAADAIEHISPEKDVDGFHPLSLGRLMSYIGTLEPCTPRGVMTMLRAYDVDLRGKTAVVVGRSIMVGRPMAQMLVRANATVTVCHRHTQDLAAAVAQADVVVVATGVAELIKGAWIKPGAVVIDVGQSHVNGRIIGDVEFDAARERASLITPVPGGVGPMTVATLMENTIRAAASQAGVAIEPDGVRRHGEDK